MQIRKPYRPDCLPPHPEVGKCLTICGAFTIIAVVAVVCLTAIKVMGG